MDGLFDQVGCLAHLPILLARRSLTIALALVVSANFPAPFAFECSDA